MWPPVAPPSEYQFDEGSNQRALDIYFHNKHTGKVLFFRWSRDDYDGSIHPMGRIIGADYNPSGPARNAKPVRLHLAATQIGLDARVPFAQLAYVYHAKKQKWLQVRSCDAAKYQALWSQQQARGAPSQQQQARRAPSQQVEAETGEEGDLAAVRQRLADLQRELAAVHQEYERKLAEREVHYNRLVAEFRQMCKQEVATLQRGRIAILQEPDWCVMEKCRCVQRPCATVPGAPAFPAIRPVSAYSMISCLLSSFQQATGPWGFRHCRSLHRAGVW